MHTLADLKPDDHNARSHNPRNIGMIVDSLQQVGAARGIVVDEDNVILAGNGVVEAAAIAGIENVKIVDVDGNTIVATRRTGLTDKQKTLLKLYDNRTGELSSWNTEQLVEDAKEIDISKMFSAREWEELTAINIATIEEDSNPVGEVPPLTCPKCGYVFEAKA